MNRIYTRTAVALCLTFGAVATSFAQSALTDVTLEVLDDSRDVDGVVIELKDARDLSEERDRRVEEQRQRPDFDRAVERDRERDREGRLRDALRERSDRREVQNEEEDLEGALRRLRDRREDAASEESRGAVDTAE